MTDWFHTKNVPRKSLLKVFFDLAFERIGDEGNQESRIERPIQEAARGWIHPLQYLPPDILDDYAAVNDDGVAFKAIQQERKRSSKPLLELLDIGRDSIRLGRHAYLRVSTKSNSGRDLSP